MNILTALPIAAGLAMDAFAVTVCRGMAVKRLRFLYAAKLAFSFALFQAAMPVIGWFAGKGFSEKFEKIDRFIAFGLLCAIGIKMIVEAVKDMKNTHCTTVSKDEIGFRMLMALSVATSIDALAVGVTFACSGVDTAALLLRNAAIIGAVTFAFCLAGAYIGRKFGDLIKDKAEIAGGCILVLIGVKIAVFG